MADINIVDWMTVPEPHGVIYTMVGFKVLAIKWHWFGFRRRNKTVLIEDCYGNQQWMTVGDIYKLQNNVTLGASRRF